MQDLGILVFGHTRPLLLADTLESLRRQDALKHVELWIDGHQGVPQMIERISVTHKIAEDFDVAHRFYHRGHLGFRKMILLAMQRAVREYRYIVLLEDDCFPTRNAIETFTEQLRGIEEDDQVFSVYGHHFRMAEESGLCTRFQGWGWATTAVKLQPYLEKLIACYSMYEADYLKFTEEALTPEIIDRLDVTPPRQPSYTLRSFFSWDETLSLVTALDGLFHKPTPEQVIFNCGIGENASRFEDREKFTRPPFNIVSHKDIWDYF